MVRLLGFKPTKKMLRVVKIQELQLPVVEPVVEPLVEPVVEPVIQPVIQPVVQPVVQLVPVLVKYPYPPQSDVFDTYDSIISDDDTFEKPVQKIKKKKNQELQRKVEVNPLQESKNELKNDINEENTLNGNIF